MICLYHTDPEVWTSISGSTHSYFINLEKMGKTTNDQERNETLIAYLIRTLEHCVIGGRNIFPISPENTVIMSNEISEVTYTVFKDLTMNTLERFCEHCYTLDQRVRGEGLKVLSLTTPTPDLRINIPELIMKRINFVYDQPCRNIIDCKRCDHKMTNDLKSHLAFTDTSSQGT